MSTTKEVQSVRISEDLWQDFLYSCKQTGTRPGFVVEQMIRSFIRRRALTLKGRGE